MFRSLKYIRKPVDFNELDDVGHGIKSNTHPVSGAGRRPSASSTVSKSSNTSVDG